MKRTFVPQIGNPVSLLLLFALILTGCNTSAEKEPGETGEPVWTEIDPFFCEGGCDATAWMGASFPESQIGYVVGGANVGKTTDGGETWTHVNLGTGVNLRDVDFVNTSTGWATGSEKAVFKTTDGGQTWTKQLGTPGGPELVKVDFINATVGWAVGNGILKTTDGGTSWVQQKPENSGDRFEDVKFLNASVGWAQGRDTLKKTTDGGQTWAAVNPDSIASSHWASVAVLNLNTIWAIREGGDWLYKTTDGGAHWTQAQRPEVGRYISMSFADENRGWIFGEDGDTWKTTDGGATWKATFNETGEDFQEAVFLNATTGFAVGSGNVILKTTDAGVTWLHLTAERKQGLNAVHFVNATTGWVVGGRGKILKTSNGGKTWKVQAGTLQHEGDANWETVLAVKFLNASVGWVLSNPSFRTTDGGTHWNHMNVQGVSMDFVDLDNGWITYSDLYGWRTTDGGTTWNKVAGLEGQALDFVSLSTGWSKMRTDILQTDHVHKTTDGGVSWTNQLDLPPGSNGDGLYFLNASTGWVTGAGGMIRKTTDGGATWISQVSGTSLALNHLAFADGRIGMASSRGVLLKTANGGDTWSMVDSTWGPDAVHFVNAKLAYAISGQRVYKYAPP